jgi:hypothetical protein
VVAAGVSDCVNHGSHWYDACLMLVGDPEPLAVSGVLPSAVALAALPADDWHRGDPPPVFGVVELGGGATLTVLPQGPAGKSAITISGTEGRLEIWASGMAPGAGTTHATLLRPPQDGGGGLEAIPLPLPPVPTEAEGENAWPRGQEVARDLLRATAAAVAASGGAPAVAGEGWLTLCSVAEARHSVEVGFAMHASSRLGGARVALPVADRAAGITVDSRAWGNLPT